MLFCVCVCVCVKGKLEMILGAAAGFMDLQLKDHTGALICKMDDDDSMLGAYPVEDFLELYVSERANLFHYILVELRIALQRLLSPPPRLFLLLLSHE